MTQKLPRNLNILREAVRQILAQEGIDKDGIPFVGGINSEIGLRLTQNEALTAYDSFLVIHENPQRGYFEIPTGIGKTLLFLALTKFAHLEAKRRGIEDFRTIIVVPTTELLKQTKESIETYAPELLDYVGLCGGSPKDRDISQPITIITYASWQKMVEQGLLNYENTDLLISDEAHRGLSDRHKDNFFNAFGEETISIGFTATSEFDFDKTVERTHEQLIYSKDIRTAIRGGELAAYIQAQLVKIRIDPSELSDEFNEEAEGKNTDSYRARLRQGAWNQYMLGIYKYGRDEHTGDLLNENQTAFFTADTAHADRLEELLNNDIHLQSIARERSYDGVAVAIHTNGMSSKEQETRMKAYQAGHYMAVIGDSKFKEGFDHKPLKTIFDFQRGSLVDKAQILGRGARQWFNPNKQRFEGMTLIDSIIYIGHEDPEIDQKIYEAHLKNAVIATSILDADHVFSEPEEDRFKNRKKGSERIAGGLSDIFPDDKNIQIYATQEDLKIILADIQRVNQKRDLIEITDEMRVLLDSEMDRTGFGSKKITQLKGCPVGLGASTIDRWRNIALQADPEHWNWVLNTLEEIPNAEIKIEITDEMRAYLNSEMKRTGLSFVKISQIKGCPENLTHSTIQNWKYGLAVSVNSSYWDWFVNALREIPDAQAKIDFTDQMRDKFLYEMKRTNTGTQKISGMKDLPEDLSIGILNALQSGRARSINIDHWNWLIRTLVSLTNQKEISEEMRDLLISEVKRTNIGSMRMSKFVGFPEDLSYTMIENWKKKEITQRVNMDHWNWVIGTLKSIPDAGYKIDLTNEMRNFLKSEMERTSIGTKKLVSFDDCPENITASIINGWLKGSSITKINRESWNWVINTLKSIESETRIELTESMIGKLRGHIERSGIGTKNFVKRLSNTNIKESMIDDWVRARLNTAKSSSWNLVFNAYASLPDKVDRYDTNIVSIYNLKAEPEKAKKLFSEVERTQIKGAGVTVLISKNNSLPKGLSQPMIKRILSGQTNLVRSDHYNFLVEFMSSLPTRIILTNEHREILIAHKDRTGIGYRRISKIIGEIEISRIDNWSSGGSTIADEALWKKLINTYASLPDKTQSDKPNTKPPEPS